MSRISTPPPVTLCVRAPVTLAMGVDHVTCAGWPLRTTTATCSAPTASQLSP
ncbi:MAG: hypothetical protein M5U26_29095 [Planctomycetota bacterium]|nr:hypothetical protein [Planctomycetota bacterium]